MLRRLFRRTKPTSGEAMGQRPPAIDHDQLFKDVLGTMNAEAEAFHRGEVEPSKAMEVPPLGALTQQEAEDAASLEAGRRLFSGESAEPTFADLVAVPIAPLSPREEEFHLRISEQHRESMVDFDTPGRQALLYLIVMKFNGGWAATDYEEFDRLIDDLAAQAKAHPTGRDGEVPDPVTLAAGRVYRFLVGVGCG